MDAAQAAQNPVRELYGALWKQAEGTRAQLGGALALLGGAQLLRLAMPALAGHAINALQRIDYAAAARWVAALAVVYLASWLLHGPGRILERNVGLRVRERLADTLYARIADAPLDWSDAQHSGELQHRVHQASRALSDFAQNQFVYLASAVNFIGPLVALSLLSTWCGALAISGYVLIGAVVLRFDRALMRLARQENDADRRYVAALLDFLSNAATVVGLRLTAAARVLLGRRMAAISKPLARTVVLNEGKWFAVDLLGMALTWGLVVLYVLQNRGPAHEGVALGSVFMIYQYAQQAAGVVGSMASNFQAFARMHTDYGSAAPLWVAPARVSDRQEEAIAADAAWTVLRLEGLQWRYQPRTVGPAPGAASPADATQHAPTGLHDITIDLRAGQRVALVGPSGGGKSTLLRVLAGLYTPGGGQLYLDGQAAELRVLRRLGTLIPQEAEVFEASVRENLDFDQGDVPAERIEAALHASSFDEVLQGARAGIDMPLAERGANLSGGQRQRLCLARGVLAAHGSTLLLMDEPTSALDAATEARVLERIAAAYPQACLVASIHRLSLLPRFFDAVLMMESGRIVDQGPVAEVLARQPSLRVGAAP